jgi:septal ring factor EnvC (AmiA/AmiB activator)
MKKTKFEQFIHENHTEFDLYEVPSGLWDKIDKSLNETQKKGIPPSEESDEIIIKFKKSSISKMKMWAMAASILLLIGCFSVFFFQKKSNSTEQIVANVAPQYGNKMVQYASLIETKREEIRQIEEHEPVMYREFETEIERLNKDYQALQTELSNTPNQEDLVKAMVQNLQVQLDILNRQLTIIEKVKEYKHNPMKSI